MISTPKLSDLFFDVVLTGGIGSTLSSLSGVDPKLSLAVIAIANIANHLLFQLSKRWVGPQLNLSSKAIYVITNTLVVTTTILVAQQFQLISNNMAGLLVFATLGLLLTARIKILASSP